MLRKEIGLRVKNIRLKLKILCDMTGLSADYILFGKDSNSTLNLSKKLSGYSDEEIKLGCATLENLALFLKHID